MKFLIIAILLIGCKTPVRVCKEGATKAFIECTERVDINEKAVNCRQIVHAEYCKLIRDTLTRED